MITADQKARELINMYYANSKTQLQAIEIVERVVLTSMCQVTDDLHLHFYDYDTPLVKNAVDKLKWQQEIACALTEIKNQIPV